MALDIKPNDLWNGERSPTVWALNYKFTKLGMGNWDNNRVKRTCDYIGITLSELCATAGVFHPRNITLYVNRNRWPMTLAIHFDRLRQVVMSVRLKVPLNPTPADLAIVKLLANKQTVEEVPFRTVYDPSIQML